MIVAGVLVALLLLVLAWIDGGREDLKMIEQSVQLPSEQGA